MNYSATLNRPQTFFPMRANLLQRQGEVLRRWQAQDIYRLILEDRRDARPFVIHDGPPYASGQMHIGIGMNKILKDMVSKFHSMNDRRVAFVPGWDCHGLPIEWEVLRNLGPQATELSALDIREQCEAHALRHIREQKRQFQRLGIFADWDRPYLTMNPSYESGVLTVFLDLVEKGYVYRSLHPVAWCYSCGTALAEAEIEYRAGLNSSALMHYKAGETLAKLCNFSQDCICSFLVWTKDVRSVLGSMAVVARADLSYGAFAFTDDAGARRVIITREDVAATTLRVLGITGYEKVESFQGKMLEGQNVFHPLFDRQVPIVSTDYSQEDSPSGLIHIAPGHGSDDFTIGRLHGIEVKNVIDKNGRFTAAAQEFSGMQVTEAEHAVIEAMARRGSLVSTEKQESESPHCWRCANPLIVRATEQWFLKLNHSEKPGGPTLREEALIEIEVTNWMPVKARDQIRAMIATRPDWCISRQRLWGVPIPALVCSDCHESILDPQIIKRVRDLVGTNGSKVWFERAASEFFPSTYRCPACGGQEIDKDSNILDVWFESATSWQSILIADHRLNFPADLYLEGTDQHRGWFQLSLLLALAVRRKAPFQTALTHGFVLNANRTRISRFHSDLITIEQTLRDVPVDIVRLYFASMDTSGDIPFTSGSFKSVEPLYRRIRNTFRYLLGNLDDFVPREHAVHLSYLHPLDLWMLCEFHQLISKVSEDYLGYQFHVAVRRIHDFCREFLSKIYFDVVKDRLYCEAPGSQTRRSTQTVLHSILMGLVKLLAPILPYTCEEVWALTPGRADCPSVHLSRWPRTDEQLLHKKESQIAQAVYSRLVRLRRVLLLSLERLEPKRRVRQRSEVAVRLHVKDGLKSLLEELSLSDLRDFLMVSEVEQMASSEGLTPIESLPGVSFSTFVSSHQKCQRCRRRDQSCKANPQHPDLCGRCASVLQSRDTVSVAANLTQAPFSPDMRPADFVKFLRARDIRKLAILNEEGRCRVYGLHAPSQEVRSIEEVQSLADYVNTSPDFRGHAALLLGLGEHTDVLFGIGIHRLKYGTPLGGTREFAYLRIGDLIDNLLRLSWGMSLKIAVAELPHGGGKSIIDPCGWDLKVHREFRREIYRDFGQFNATLFGRYICAEDVGNTTADTREMLSTCRHVMCLSQGVSGSGNPSRFTALAAWAAAKAGWKFLTGITSFENLTIALQGAGNVGRNFVSILIESDPGIHKIIIADRDPEQIQIIRNQLLKHGKASLLEIVSSKDLEDESSSTTSYIERKDEKGKGYILYAPCDILVPVAVGNVISPRNVPLLNCQLIVPIANNVYSDNDTVAVGMMDRGIVDVVENNINWGGAMAAASEIFGYDEDNVTAACLEAYDRTLTLLVEAQRRGCTPWQIVKEIASTRIFEQEHPIVHEARKYRHIGNINDDFTDWIKHRWLRNLIDVEPDSFSRYAVNKAKAAID
jgi:isoleucyl-tRNA synthetase